MKQKLTIVTSNANKAVEVAAFFSGTLEVSHVALEIPEHRSDDVGEIARGKAQYAYDQLRTPLIVDDTGFSIDALSGFPGPYAAYVLHTIGNTGILKLMDAVKNRQAHFTTAIAYADESGIRVFTGSIHGSITTSPRGENGFGYDPIVDINGRTLAEISLEEKSVMSHRAKALVAFRDWFLEKYPSGPLDTNG
ncbi:MAG: non-canonical purine NTP pyrophosphatase, RdgB/HAM1 family [Methanomicrobiales archaeon HGW-Methanomicrobiales-1]|nr:MAG: non-canonical purine NTP pyrophosphatase, RdgB/HAM1 family [Methanomicrobiales archaeon HGW-Methanomicrobiales-1]